MADKLERELDYCFDFCMMRLNGAKMKILQRTINVFAVLFLAISLYLPFRIVGDIGDRLDFFLKIFGTSLALILIANYIFFGKATLWNRIEKDE